MRKFLFWFEVIGISIIVLWAIEIWRLPEMAREDWNGIKSEIQRLRK